MMNRFLQITPLLFFFFLFSHVNAQHNHTHGNNHQTLDKLELINKGVVQDHAIGSQEFIAVRDFIFSRIDKYSSLIATMDEDSLIQVIVGEYIQAKNNNQIQSQNGYSNISSFNNSYFNKKVPIDKGPGQPCNNADIETCDLSGWELFEGETTAAPFGITNIVPTNMGSGMHTVVSGGMDAEVPISRNSPFGGSCSVMLGDSTRTGGKIAILRQTFQVSATSSSLVYNYALVMETPSNNPHTPGEMPFFKINMYDQSGNIISCADYSVISGQGGSDFIPFYSLFGTMIGEYLPWRSTFVPLDAYIGQDVTIEFMIADCDLGGHYGYGYFDASCSALEITSSNSVLCPNDSALLKAPAGAKKYLWNTGDTTANIVVYNPGTYSVNVIPVAGGANCNTTLSYTVTNAAGYPDAAITATPINACINTPISLNDNSSVVGNGAIVSWEWDIDADGVVDNTNQNTSYSYNTLGPKQVLLEVSTADCKDKDSIIINVVGAPTADFSYAPGCEGSSISISDESSASVGSNIIKWYWDFNNNGVIDDSIQNPSHTFPGAGIFPVTLTVYSSEGCSNAITKNITVYPKPLADFTSTIVCLGDTVKVNDVTASLSGITQWEWDLDGNSLIDAFTPNASCVYPVSGSHSVHLRVTDNNGCEGDTSIAVLVNVLPIANFSSTSECLQDITTVTDGSITPSGISQWKWDFDEDMNVDAASSSANHVFTTPGSHPVHLFVMDNNGCTHDTIIPVTVYDLPVADFTSSTVCLNQTTDLYDNSTSQAGLANWEWYFNGNLFVNATTQNTNTIYGSAGNHPVSLKVTDNNGCSQDTSIMIVVHDLPIANFTSSIECFGFVTNMSDASISPVGINALEWSFNGNATIDATTTTTGYAFPTPGNHDVHLNVVDNNGCEKDTTIAITLNALPKASFSSTPVCLGNITPFTDESISSVGVNSWEWDFNDDGVADDILQNTNHIFPTSGVHSVALNVVDMNGCKNDTSINIIVTSPPVVNFSATDICQGNPTNFIDASTTNNTLTKWEWDFESDGTIDGYQQNAINQYATSGLYNTSLTVTDSYGCSADTLIQVEVFPLPDVDFSFQDVCDGSAVNYVNNTTISTGSIVGYTWNFGDGVGTSTLLDPNYTYSGSGGYSVGLVAMTNNNCSKAIVKTVNVFENPIAAFGFNNACEDSVVQFIDQSYNINNGAPISNYFWDVDGDNSTDYFTASPSHAYSTFGNYSVKLSVESFHGCTGAVQQNIKIHANPSISYTSSNVCEDSTLVFTATSSVPNGNITTYSWDFGDGTTGNINNNPTHIYTSEGQYNTSLSVVTDSGCVASFVKEITIFPNPKAVFTTTDICVDEILDFQNQSQVSGVVTPSGIVSYTWNYGDGSAIVNTQNASHSYTNPGVYTVDLAVITNNGCQHLESKVVNVYEVPVVDFTTTNPKGCSSWCVDFNDITTIGDGQLTNYYWDFGDGTFSTDQQPTHCFSNSSLSTPKLYDVKLTVTSNTGCKAEKELTDYVEVYPMPKAAFSFTQDKDVDFSTEVDFLNESLGSTSSIWLLGDQNNTLTTELHPSFEYADTGYYFVELFVENSYQCKDTTGKWLHVEPSFSVYIPNVFTPDEDLLNDVFSVVGYGVKDVEMLIFDRWGKNIYTGTGYTKNPLGDQKTAAVWDGRYNGELVQQDVYVYRIKVLDIRNKWHDYRGKVTLLK